MTPDGLGSMAKAAFRANGYNRSNWFLLYAPSSRLPPGGTRMRHIGRKVSVVVWASVATLGLALALACSPEPQVREVEVTREVAVAQEIPVTVEVTREVSVVREVPVTVDAVKSVEVTVPPPTAETVEVTREVPVTRIVVATPTSPTAADATLSPTPTAASPTATPLLQATVEPTTPTPTSTPAPASVSSNDARFGAWIMDQEPVIYGESTAFLFRTDAIASGISPEAPVLTYECDTRGGRAFYIDWHQPVVGAGPGVKRYSENPFEQYRDEDLDAIAGLAGNLLGLVNDLDLHGQNQRDRQRMWEQVARLWGIDPATSQDLITQVRERNHKTVLVQLDFFNEPSDPDRASRYGAPIVETISEWWVVAPAHRTQASASVVGQLTSAHRKLLPPAILSISQPQNMAAMVKTPEQPFDISAKWDITGFDKVSEFCRLRRR